MPIHEVFTYPDMSEEEELCSKCRGQGRVVFCHRMMGGHDYTECHQCNGSGKTIKRPKCKIDGCEHKQDLISGHDPKTYKPLNTLEPNGLCEDHAEELHVIKAGLTTLQALVKSEEAKMATLFAKVIEFQKQLDDFNLRIK